MKTLIIVFLFLASLLMNPVRIFAVENPLSVPNNKYGIHILFPEELTEAVQLINTSGGDWGYVTIPIQAGDKDIEKWQKFMDSAKQHHVIPLVRLATEGDYFNTKVWRKPTENDLIDFSNFLDSLEWPTKNRYIIVFNEVNRSDEWGGSTNPSEYAQILSYAVDVFKSKNSNFFIIVSGMDNAAATVLGSAYNQYSYFTLMEREVPGVFKKIDGISSHSYPNPAFAQPPSKQDYNSIASFRFESSLLESYAGKKLPIFITETGWSNERVSDSRAAQYYQETFTTVWNDERIVAVTPFLLRAGGGPFTQFSFFKTDGSRAEIFKKIASLPKVKGQPHLSEKVLGSTIAPKPIIQTKQFENVEPTNTTIQLSQPIKTVLKWLLNL